MIQDIKITVDGISYTAVCEGPSADCIKEIRLINDHTKGYVAKAYIDHNTEQSEVAFYNERGFEEVVVPVNYFEMQCPKLLAKWMASV